MPKEFRVPRDIIKYDGIEDPRQWLDDYRVTIKCTGGNRITAMQCLQLFLKGPARAWLKSLAPESIGLWVELKAAFVRNFQTTCAPHLRQRAAHMQAKVRRVPSLVHWTMEHPEERRRGRIRRKGDRRL
jgi:hypothetical protein